MRVVSSVSMPSSIENGGVTEVFSTSMPLASTSISPVAMFGFTVPSARARTLPVIFSTNSRPRCSATSRIPRPETQSGSIDDLRVALAVAKVHEDQAAVVAVVPHPASEGDLRGRHRRHAARRTWWSCMQYSLMNSVIMAVYSSLRSETNRSNWAIVAHEAHTAKGRGAIYASSTPSASVEAASAASIRSHAASVSA